MTTTESVKYVTVSNTTAADGTREAVIQYAPRDAQPRERITTLHPNGEIEIDDYELHTGQVDCCDDCDAQAKEDYELWMDEVRRDK